MSSPDIAIIGAGRVGTALGVLAARSGWGVLVASRRAAAAEAAARRIDDRARACSVAQAASAAGLILLTVPDDAIGTLCGELAAGGALAHRPVVAHCSGALSSEVLAPARQAGCPVGSCHPLQTFPTVDAAVERLHGARFFIEGDESAIAALEPLVRDVGGRAVRIAGDRKTLYHAAAVLASNGLVTLLDAVGRLGAAAGLDADEHRTALGPLVRATVDNVLSLGPPVALTGPIERGDVATIRCHVAALRRDVPDVAEAFCALGKLTVDLARRKGSIDAETARTLRDVLDTPHGKE
ncbi:MAG: DUF2520 domain-containing protein [Phycisphaerae bacterium]|nr:DUF2520 domain-containing protein [Phycisphaerae bacterium]